MLHKPDKLISYRHQGFDRDGSGFNAMNTRNVIGPRQALMEGTGEARAISAQTTVCRGHLRLLAVSARPEWEYHCLPRGRKASNGC